MQATSFQIMWLSEVIYVINTFVFFEKEVWFFFLSIDIFLFSKTLMETSSLPALNGN